MQKGNPINLKYFSFHANAWFWAYGSNYGTPLISSLENEEYTYLKEPV